VGQRSHAIERVVGRVKDSEKEERDTEKGSSDEDARETRFSDTVASMMENDKRERTRLNGGR